MTEMNLKGAGLPNYKYAYAGSLKRFILPDGKKVRVSNHPWSLSESEQTTLASDLNIPLEQLEDVLFAMAAAYEKTSKDKKHGKESENTKEISWEDALKYDAKGNPNGLNAEVIAQLICQDCARVGDVVFLTENNIGNILTKGDLKIKILEGLKTVKAAEFYGTNTYQLVYDQLLPLVPSKKLGSIDGFIPMRNGVLDICQGKIISTDDIYLKTTNVDYRYKNTECPKISQMLDNMFEPAQKEMVLSIIGAAISGRRAPFILALSGAGRNGKSLFREILEALMMEMITTEKLENLDKVFINEVFMGKRISWQTEVSSKRAFLDQIKEVTGGTTIQVRKKFVDGTLQYPLQMICIIDTNNPPHFDNSQAINDRMRFVNMPHKFVYELTGSPNEVLIDTELTNGWEKELPAFFNMLLPYAQHFIKYGRLMYDIDGTVNELRDRTNLIGGFLDTYYEERETMDVDFRKMYKLFVKYAEKKNVAAPDTEHLRYKLRKEYGLRIVNYKVYGLTLKLNTDIACQ